MKKLIIPVLIAFALLGGQSARAMEEEEVNPIQIVGSTAFLDYLKTVKRLSRVDAMTVEHKKLYVVAYRNWLAQQQAHQAAPVQAPVDNAPVFDNPVNLADDGVLIQCVNCQLPHQVDELIEVYGMQICGNCFITSMNEQNADQDDDMRTAMERSLQINGKEEKEEINGKEEKEKEEKECPICFDEDWIYGKKIRCQNNHAICEKCYNELQKTRTIAEEFIATDNQRQELIDAMRGADREYEYQVLLENSRNTHDNVNIPNTTYFLREGALYISGKKLELKKTCPFCRGPF